MSNSYQESEDEFVHFKDRGDLWLDIIPIDEFSNEINILKIDYTDSIREINDYFRAILNKNEISQRSFDLTTELLKVLKLLLNNKTIQGFCYKLYGMVP